jgi:hypothetical protein
MPASMVHPVTSLLSRHSISLSQDVPSTIDKAQYRLHTWQRGYRTAIKPRHVLANYSNVAVNWLLPYAGHLS